jgi:hypothetical protein
MPPKKRGGAKQVKKTAKRRKTKKGKRKSRAKGEQPTQFKVPLQCSVSLSLLLSNGEDDKMQLARSEALKRVWAYAKLKGLQDKLDGRRILCDQAMRKVFGVPHLTILTMPKALSPHLSAGSSGGASSGGSGSLAPRSSAGRSVPTAGGSVPAAAPAPKFWASPELAAVILRTEEQRASIYGWKIGKGQAKIT